MQPETPATAVDLPRISEKRRWSRAATPPAPWRISATLAEDAHARSLRPTAHRRDREGTPT